jgi:hypothetical protein
MVYLPDGTYVPEEDEEYEVTLPDAPVHTPENPFCDDMTCPCHSDQDNIDTLHQAYDDGLVSADDATHIYHGRTIK